MVAMSYPAAGHSAAGSEPRTTHAEPDLDADTLPEKDPQNGRREADPATELQKTAEAEKPILLAAHSG